MDFVLTLRLVGKVSGLNTEWDHLAWMRRFKLKEMNKVPSTDSYCGANDTRYFVSEEFARTYFGDTCNKLVEVPVDFLMPGELRLSSYYGDSKSNSYVLALESLPIKRAEELAVICLSLGKD